MSKKYDIRSVVLPYVRDEKEGTFDLYSRLLQDRIILLTTEINNHVASLICAQMLFLESENNKKPIFFYINSPGGSVYDAYTILDTMEMLKCPIYTYGFGIVASAAAVILTCGQKGNRSLLRRTRMMIHQPLGGVQGQATEIKILADEILRIKEELNGLLADRSGLSLDVIAAMTERDKYLGAEEALELGFIDRILHGNFDDKTRDLGIILKEDNSLQMAPESLVS